MHSAYRRVWFIVWAAWTTTALFADHLPRYIGLWPPLASTRWPGTWAVMFAPLAATALAAVTILTKRQRLVWFVVLFGIIGAIEDLVWAGPTRDPSLGLRTGAALFSLALFYRALPRMGRDPWLALISAGLLLGAFWAPLKLFAAFCLPVPGMA